MSGGDRPSPSETPALSIIIVNWNTRELLRACLQSIDAHSGPLPLEVIVVDNASADGSAEMVAHAFPEVRLIRNPQNRGFAAANNQGLQLARGRHLLLLNSDTEVCGGVLRDALRYLEAHDEVGVLGCRVLHPDGSLQLTCFREPDLWSLLLVTSGLHRLPWPRAFGRYQMKHWKRDDERDVDVVTGCFMLLRRDAAEDVGLFDEQFFFYAEETDWCRRFRDAGWAVRFAPVGEIIHHGGASSLLLNERKILLLGEALVRLFRKRGGRMQGGLAWVIIAGFVLSRAGWWTAAGVAGREARERGRLCRAAIRRLGEMWPREVTPRVPRLARLKKSRAHLRPAA